MRQFVVREHEIEPVSGLPGYLPEGEKMLWQGKPSRRLVARHVLKSRWIAGYFLVLASWSVYSGWSDGEPLAALVVPVVLLAFTAMALFGLISLYAWAVQKTTLYTVTNKRVVIRFGVALSMTLNLPFKQINTIALGQLSGASGNLALQLLPGHRLSWLVQWPHVRGWRFSHVEPSLICLPDVKNVADILVAAFTQYAAANSGHPRVTHSTPGEKPDPDATSVVAAE